MKLSLPSRVGAVALAGVLALSLTACGSDDPVADSPSASGSAGTGGGGLSGELNGVGASSQGKAMDAWRAAFQTANPNVTVNYDPQGSGAGRTQFIQGAADWAGSDSAMKPEELEQAKATCGSDAIDIPSYVSPIAVVFNLEGVTSLNLSPATIANIFTGKITKWDDEAIKADNPDATLPSTDITPVHRQDGSGTTKNFTDYLNKTAGGAWADEAADDWPLQGGESGTGTSGLIQAVQGGQGTIGYADESAAGTLGKASIKVGDAWVAPSADAAAVALDKSPRDTSRAANDIVVNIDRTTTEAGAYPLILVSYSVACSTYKDAAKADLVKGLLGYIVSPEGQAAAQSAAGSAPLPDALAADAKTAVDAIKGA
ncbi:MAG: phosphate ABC transporter substrate-binding protein PstS [Brevundimonas sp.]